MCRKLDVTTPTPPFYSIHYERGDSKYYVLLEVCDDKSYLIRQILELKPKDLRLVDRTFDEKMIEVVKEDLKGFTHPRNLISWDDVLIKRG